MNAVNRLNPLRLISLYSTACIYYYTVVILIRELFIVRKYHLYHLYHFYIISQMNSHNFIYLFIYLLHFYCAVSNMYKISFDGSHTWIIQCISPKYQSGRREKSLGRKGNFEEVSFEFRSNRRNRCCCAYNSRQWVPYPWSSNRERALTSRCSGSWNEKSRSLRWSGWWVMCLRYKQLMQQRLAIHDGFESEKRNFILNPLSDTEPVKIFQKWSDVLILWSLCDGPSERILHTLEFLDVLLAHAKI